MCFVVFLMLPEPPTSTRPDTPFPATPLFRSIELLRLALERPVDGDRCVIAPLPTHMELAARIGTHREAVTRELRLLHQEGIVGQQGRTLEIRSIERLRAALRRHAQ